MLPPTRTEDEEEVLQALEESRALDSEEGETEGDSVFSSEEKECLPTRYDPEEYMTLPKQNKIYKI